jgi:short-subunit dehydrogenase involved in D-alanine esterification of teichoic acids
LVIEHPSLEFELLPTLKEKTRLTTIAILGGTGKEGSGLALRWAKAGYHVIIGSRSEERAAQAASQINA